MILLLKKSQKAQIYLKKITNFQRAAFAIYLSAENQCLIGISITFIWNWYFYVDTTAEGIFNRYKLLWK